MSAPRDMSQQGLTQEVYLVCESCAHTWLSPEVPLRCENCTCRDLRIFPARIFGNADAAQEYSQTVLDAKVRS